jgi:hypothetical protein
MTRRQARFAHVVGFDDAPFARAHRGDVAVVGAVYSDAHLVGVLRTKVRRDGRNGTSALAAAVEGCRFRPQLHLVLLEGIAVAGFNVIDIAALHERLGIPVLVVARREPDYAAVRRALLGRVPGGARKWRIIERTGPMEGAGALWVQRAGLDLDEARAALRRWSTRGNLPEPLRVAHLIAGALG